MSASENKQLIETIFSELSKGNSKPLADTFSDKVRWNISGSIKWSRTYDGKEAVFKQLLGPLASLVEGPIRLTAHRIIAEGDYVVVEARGNSTTKSGKDYNNTYCFVIRVVDGKIEELTEYMDTALAVAVFGE
ncbi:MAG TPA: nuclear transport factor 2 family protein [Blastocatellia bacterium]|nr:nuclear transport factor 2 family protein [Blastocatellia bacterium]